MASLAAPFAKELRRADESCGVGMRSQNAGPGRAVVAFPPAGGDGRAFDPLAGVFAALAPETAFHAIDPPGRALADRVAPRDVRGYAAGAARAIAQFLPDDADVRLFGHSFGGYVALETARSLLRAGVLCERLSLVLFAAAPRQQIARLASELADDERWVERLRSLGGISERALSSPFFRALYLPVIQADLRDGGAYLESGPSYQELSDIDVTVVAAEEDSLVSVHDMASWQGALPGSRFATLPCGHFPDERALPALAALLAGENR